MLWLAHFGAFEFRSQICIELNCALPFEHCILTDGLAHLISYCWFGFQWFFVSSSSPVKPPWGKRLMKLEWCVSRLIVTWSDTQSCRMSCSCSLSSLLLVCCLGQWYLALQFWSQVLQETSECYNIVCCILTFSNLCQRRCIFNWTAGCCFAVPDVNAPFIVMCILPSDLSGLTLLSACVYRTFTPCPSKFLLYTIPIFVAVIQYTVHEYPDGLVPVLLASLLQVLGQLAHM